MILCILTSGLRLYTKLYLRSSNLDETSIGASSFSKDGPDGLITLRGTRPVEKNEYGEEFQNKAPKEDSPEENQALQFEFLEKLDIKVYF